MEAKSGCRLRSPKKTTASNPANGWRTPRGSRGSVNCWNTPNRVSLAVTLMESVPAMVKPALDVLKNPASPPAVETDIRKVLEDKTVTALVVAAPDHWHALATVWAAERGKHVYVEKPVSHDLAEGRRMVQAAR